MSRHQMYLPDDLLEAYQTAFKRRSGPNATNWMFLESLNENGRTVYERVLALGKQDGIRIN